MLERLREWLRSRGRKGRDNQPARPNLLSAPIQGSIGSDEEERQGEVAKLGDIARVPSSEGILALR